MPEVLALPHRVPTLGRAVEQFLAAKPLSANERRSYAHTLGTVVGDLGADLALSGFTAERVHRVNRVPNHRIKRIAFGFRNFANYRIRALALRGETNWELLGTFTLHEIR